MIKDTVFKSILIPLLGIFIPVFSNLIRYGEQSSLTRILYANLLFITTTYLIWQGTVFLVSRLRASHTISRNIYAKLLLLCGLTATFGGAAAGLASFLWQRFSSGTIHAGIIKDTALLSAFLVVLITLVYEILFLNKERELDNKLVDQLDRERQYAEMSVLKNELDPHFLFNSLVALSHLIGTDTDKARQFIHKLAQAYKYVLINKDRDVIALEDELRFIDDYFYLLQIRHDHKLKMVVDLNGSDPQHTKILPCAFQMLIENAIKHNMFTEEHPLVITITATSHYLKVENNIHSKTYGTESTKIGLKNLSNRYKMICNRDILIHRGKERFIVKLPLIK